MVPVSKSRILFCTGVVFMMAVLPALAQDRSRTDTVTRTDDGGILHERTVSNGSEERTFSRETHRERTDDGWSRDSVLTGPGGGQRTVEVDAVRHPRGVDLNRTVTDADGTVRNQTGQIRGRRNPDGSRARAARFENDRGDVWRGRSRAACENGSCTRTRAVRAPDGRQRIQREGRRRR